MRREHVLVSSAQGRLNDANMQTTPRAALVVVDRSDPNRFVQIRARVSRFTEKGSLHYISPLTHRYRGRAGGPIRDQIRVLSEILPERVFPG